MPLTAFREPNQVAWVGVRPAHRGAQVVKSNTAINNTAIIHTVTAGKVFFMTLASWAINASVAGGNCFVEVRNGLDVSQYKVMNIIIDVANQFTSSLTFWPPIEIPAGWDVTCRSGVGTLDIRAFIFGWEE